MMSLFLFLHFFKQEGTCLQLVSVFIFVPNQRIAVNPYLKL